MNDLPSRDAADDAGLLATQARGDNAPAMSVSELSQSLKRTVEDAFGHVRVRGEISGFKRHSSGHCYLTLKDENACIDGVIWRANAGALRFRPNGDPIGKSFVMTRVRRGALVVEETP